MKHIYIAKSSSIFDKNTGTCFYHLFGRDAVTNFHLWFLICIFFKYAFLSCVILVKLCTYQKYSFVLPSFRICNLSHLHNSTPTQTKPTECMILFFLGDTTENGFETSSDYETKHTLLLYKPNKQS
mmetsp:Transcript_39678/g.40291  ORF Transcript_39678/g.40291 Transcript_39678/m.40291 type:complete len:126 (-) Transcript_39678:123-500(-)